MSTLDAQHAHSAFHPNVCLSLIPHVLSYLNEEKFCPLMLAIVKVSCALESEAGLEIVRLLLAAGADMNKFYSTGFM